MPRISKPAKELKQGSDGKYRQLSDRHLCLKSPSGSHWWKISSPHGETSDGVCRYCGKHRQFANSFAGTFADWVER